MRLYIDQYVEKVVRNKEQDAIIDLGCGRGEWLEYLRDLGYAACGVDKNVKMVERYRLSGRCWKV